MWCVAVVQAFMLSFILQTSQPIGLISEVKWQINTYWPQTSFLSWSEIKKKSYTDIIDLFLLVWYCRFSNPSFNDQGAISIQCFYFHGLHDRNWKNNVLQTCWLLYHLVSSYEIQSNCSIDGATTRQYSDIFQLNTFSNLSEIFKQF